MPRPTIVRSIAVCSTALAVSIAIAIGVLLRTPVLLPWRESLTPTFFLIVGFGVLWLLQQIYVQYRRSFWWYAASLGWLTALLVGGTAELRFQWFRHEVMHSTNDESRQLGAHIVVGYRDLDTVRELAQNGLIGGIFISTVNIQGRTVAEIANEIESLQALRRARGLPRLLVSVDHEGGAVSRLSPPFAPTPSLQTLLDKAPDEDVQNIAFNYGLRHGQDLASVGINVNFAPVADLKTPLLSETPASRSLLHLRSLGSDPRRVTKAVEGYVHGLEQNRVLGTIKHFPGLGRVAVDTHLFPASIDTPIADLESTDWIPFRAGLANTRALLMVGHVKLSAVDALKPASRSLAVTDIIRTQWGHEGVLITDDLTMGAILLQGTNSAGIDAINAGIDLLLVSYDVDRYFEIFYHLRKAQQSGLLNARKLTKSDQRLESLLPPWPK